MRGKKHRRKVRNNEEKIEKVLRKENPQPGEIKEPRMKSKFKYLMVKSNHFTETQKTVKVTDYYDINGLLIG